MGLQNYDLAAHKTGRVIEIRIVKSKRTRNFEIGIQEIESRDLRFFFDSRELWSRRTSKLEFSSIQFRLNRSYSLKFRVFVPLISLLVASLIHRYPWRMGTGTSSDSNSIIQVVLRNVPVPISVSSFSRFS